jgi:hypothetical protein
VRDGEQWEVRKTINLWAKKQRSEFCTVIDHEVSESEFLDLVKQHSFILCVEGGGIDPSPKSWQTLYHGAIPIVKKLP